MSRKKKRPGGKPRSAPTLTVQQESHDLNEIFDSLVASFGQKPLCHDAAALFIEMARARGISLRAVPVVLGMWNVSQDLSRTTAPLAYTMMVEAGVLPAEHLDDDLPPFDPDSLGARAGGHVVVVSDRCRQLYDVTFGQFGGVVNLPIMALTIPLEAGGLMPNLSHRFSHDGEDFVVFYGACGPEAHPGWRRQFEFMRKHLKQEAAQRVADLAAGVTPMPYGRSMALGPNSSVQLA